MNWPIQKKWTRIKNVIVTFFITMYKVFKNIYAIIISNNNTVMYYFFTILYFHVKKSIKNVYNKIKHFAYIIQTYKLCLKNT